METQGENRPLAPTSKERICQELKISPAQYEEIYKSASELMDFAGIKTANFKEPGSKEQLKRIISTIRNRFGGFFDTLNVNGKRTFLNDCIKAICLKVPANAKRMVEHKIEKDVQSRNSLAYRPSPSPSTELFSHSTTDTEDQCVILELLSKADPDSSIIHIMDSILPVSLNPAKKILLQASFELYCDLLRAGGVVLEGQELYAVIEEKAVKVSNEAVFRAALVRAVYHLKQVIVTFEVRLAKDIPSLATSTENVAALEKEVADLHVDLEKMRSRGQAFREELALLKQDENKKAQESSTLSRSARKHKRSKPFDFDCDATSKSSDSCNEMSNPNQTVVGPSRKKRRTLEPPLENGNIYEEKQDRVVIDLENEVPRPPPGYEDGSRLLIDDGGEQNPVGEQTVEEAILALKNLSQCEQLNVHSWSTLCCMFRRSPTRRGNNDCFKMDGIKTPIKPYQLRAAVWMLETENGAAKSGFIGDEMGLGKSLETLVFLVLSRWIALNRSDINADVLRGRQGETCRHLPSGIKPASPSENAYCPSQSEWPFLCACVPASPTAQFSISKGPTVLFAPRNLLSNWIRQWKEHVEPHSGLDMQIFIGHGTAQSEFRLHPDDTTKSLVQIKEKDGYHFQGQERIVILTTSGSYENHVRKPFLFMETSEKVVSVGKTGKTRTIPQQQFFNGIRWGRVIRDEFHKERSSQSKMMAILREIRSNNPDMRFFGLSGTPWEISPEDLQQYLKVMESSSWATDQVLSLATEVNFKALIKDYREASTSKDMKKKKRDVATKFSHILTKIMIRRTSDSKWFEDSIAVLPNHYHRDVDCSPDHTYDHYIQQMAAKMQERLRKETSDKIEKWKVSGRVGGQPKTSKMNYFAYSHIDRACASIPGLSKLVAENQLKLTLGELKDMDFDKHDNNIFMQNLVMLGESSPKLQEIVRFIRLEMNQDPHAQREKLLVMSSLPITSHITAKHIALKCPELRVEHLHSMMPPGTRNQRVLAFEETVNEKGQPEFPDSADILVSTMSCLGTGLDCVRAFRVILTDPNYIKSEEIQAIFRIRRVSQKNPCTYSIRLLNRRSHIENTIVAVQEKREEFVELTYGIVEDGKDDDGQNSKLMEVVK